MSEQWTPIQSSRGICASPGVTGQRWGECLRALHYCDLAHSVLHVFLEGAVGGRDGQQDAVGIGLALGEGVRWVGHRQEGDAGGRSKAHGGDGV